MKIKTKYRLKILIVIIYMIIIYIISEHKFPDPSEGTSTQKISLLPFLHMGEFGLLSLLLMFAFYNKINKYILMIASILYGIFDELHQFFVPYRWFDYNDIVCDSIGAIIGIFAYLILILIYNYFFIFPKIR